MNRSAFLLLLGLVILVSGFVKAAQTVKATRDAEARLDGKLKRLATLHALQHESGTLDLNDLARAELQKPDSLRRLADVYLDGYTTSVNPPKREKMDARWEKQSTTLELSNVPWPDLARFLEKVGNHRHPWRIAAYDLTPGAGGATGSLRFETVVLKQ